MRGSLIKAGEKVTFWWPSANRDEEVFAEPDVFDIRRNPNPHLSFGTGTYFCMGDEVGRLEIRLVLEALLDRVAEIRTTAPVTYAPNNNDSRHAGRARPRGGLTLLLPAFTAALPARATTLKPIRTLARTIYTLTHRRDIST